MLKKSRYANNGHTSTCQRAMNYAEDRLDRRAAGSTIGADLDAAHAALREAGDALLLHAGAAINSTVVDAGTQHASFDVSSPEIIGILQQLRSAHELCGRSLRDRGLCRQASYHYGLAWSCDPTSSTGAGDYAQMADLAGYPEVGILSLLYFRVGGGEQLDRTMPIRVELEAALRRRRRRHGPTARGSTTASSTGNEDSTTCTASSTDNEDHCGCHHPQCGSSPCHVVLPTSGNSPLLAELLSDLDEIAQLDNAPSSSGRTTTATAADILEGLSRAARAEKQSRRNGRNNSNGRNSSNGNDNGNADGSTTSSSSRSTTDQSSFLPPLDAMPPNLCFWEEQASFPPLLQILLLKLLYASSAGGPFLRLACSAVPHLAVRMPPSSPLGQRLARDNKSHLAYYVLIRAVVLGERVKKHRRGTAGGVPYHVPVWDVVHGVDQRDGVVAKVVEGAGAPASASAEVAMTASSFSRRIQALLDDLTATSTTDRSACTLPPTSHVLPSCLPAATSHPPLFVLGDSHCLSIAWQTIKIDNPARRSEPPMLRTLVPYPATGIKAWHTRDQTQFFTHHNLRTSLQRLPPGCRTVLLSAGEIDCREGIGGEKLSGYNASCDDRVRNTVREYVRAATRLATEHNLQILLLPVAPHAFRNAKKGKAAGRDQRRERILLWNDLLRDECATSGGAGNGIYLLDYEGDLRSPDEISPVGFVLNRAFNADYTHLNSAFLGHLEAALGRCIEEYGCRIELI